MTRIFLPLALAQTLIWASTFYLFPALLIIWERQTPWSKSEISVAFTLSLLSLSLVSVLSGRLVDRGLGAHTMLTATCAASLGLMGLSYSTELWHFYFWWIWLGCAMGAGLYEICFAILVRHYGLEARRLITRITLIAGFAGTVSFPLTNLLALNYGWRVCVFVAGISVLLIVLPLNIFGLRHVLRVPIPSIPKTKNSNSPRQSYRLFLLALAFTLVTVSSTMLMTHLIALLVERGTTLSFAILIASLVGPMQVLGRLLFLSAEDRITIHATALLCFLGLSSALLILFFSGTLQFWIFLFVIFHGACWGILSILRPLLIRLTLGAEGHGLNSGSISSFSFLGSAIAPFGGAYLWVLGGYNLLLIVGFTFCLLGFFALLGLRR